MRIAIVEDERSYQEHLIKCMGQYEKEEIVCIQPQVFSDGEEIIRAYENGNDKWDIIFLDIKMKHMDGLETAYRIREKDTNVVLIFITTMGQYAIRGYEVDALDFILKPVTYGQFKIKMHKAIKAVKKCDCKYLFLPRENQKDKVSTDDILFIEIQNHDLHVVTRLQTYVMRNSMREMEKELEELPFSRCSNAYLVNLKQVKKIVKDTIFVYHYELTMTRTKKKQFLQDFADYIGDGY